jgi:hypothetical protein
MRLVGLVEDRQLLSGAQHRSAGVSRGHADKNRERDDDENSHLNLQLTPP